MPSTFLAPDLKHSILQEATPTHLDGQILLAPVHDPPVHHRALVHQQAAVPWTHEELLGWGVPVIVGLPNVQAGPHLGQPPQRPQPEGVVEASLAQLLHTPAQRQEREVVRHETVQGARVRGPQLGQKGDQADGGRSCQAEGQRVAELLDLDFAGELTENVAQVRSTHLGRQCVENRIRTRLHGEQRPAWRGCD